jgi:chaperonin GroES
MDTFKPLQDRVLIQRINVEQKTKGGIFIPDSAQEKPLEGEVIAVGSGRYSDGKKICLEVKVGDRVLFTKYSEIEVTLKNKKYLLLKEDDILGIVE